MITLITHPSGIILLALVLELATDGHYSFLVAGCWLLVNGKVAVKPRHRWGGTEWNGTRAKKKERERERERERDREKYIDRDIEIKREKNIKIERNI